MTVEKDYAKAKKILDTALIYGGQHNRDVLFMLGEVFKAQGKWGKALRVCKQAFSQCKGLLCLIGDLDFGAVDMLNMGLTSSLCSSLQVHQMTAIAALPMDWSITK